MGTINTVLSNIAFPHPPFDFLLVINVYVLKVQMGLYKVYSTRLSSKTTFLSRVVQGYPNQILTRMELLNDCPVMIILKFFSTTNHEFITAIYSAATRPDEQNCAPYWSQMSGSLFIEAYVRGCNQLLRIRVTFDNPWRKHFSHQIYPVWALLSNPPGKFIKLRLIISCWMSSWEQL